MAVWFNNADEENDNIFEDNTLTSREILVYVLSSVSLDSLPVCARVCRDWYLVVKYLVPTPLSQLRMVACGELLYHLRLNEDPRTVILRVSFAMGQPKWVEIVSCKTSNSALANNNKDDDNNNNNNQNGSISTISSLSSSANFVNHAIIHLRDIKFIINGHWTPTFEHLKNVDDFNLHESQFFSSSKSFSIVTNSFMTYDFIAFNSETCKDIVSILRNILRQSSSNAKKMAIFAKANNKYTFAMQQQNKQLMFTNNRQALAFDLFVMTLRDAFHEIGNEIEFPMPKSCITSINASNLYPTIIEENIVISKWREFCRSQILQFLQKDGLIDILHSPDGDVAYDAIAMEDEETPDGAEEKPNVTLNTMDSNLDNDQKNSRFVPFTPHNQPVAHFKTYLQTIAYEKENGVKPGATGANATKPRNNMNGMNGMNGMNQRAKSMGNNGKKPGHARRSSRTVAENVQKGTINAHEGYQQLKHVRNSSSLFNLKSFPTEADYDLFKGGVNNEAAGDEMDNKELANLANMYFAQNSVDSNTPQAAPNGMDPTQDGQQCLVM